MKDRLITIYLEGFSDELWGCFENKYEGIDSVAYEIGANHCIIGDEISSIDHLTHEEITKIITDVYNKSIKK